MSEIQFVIVAERGAYSDYTKNNLFIVRDNETAQQVANILNSVTEKILQFMRNEFRLFDEHYRATNPLPKKTNLRRPLVPESLDGLSKHEKEKYPEYQKYLKELKEYEEKLYNIESDKTLWYQNHNLALKNFKQEHLQVENLLPEKFREKLLKYLECTGGNVEFSVEELEVI